MSATRRGTPLLGETHSGRALRRRELEDRIGALAATQHGIVTHAQLLDAGLRPGAIRRRVQGGRLHLFHRGVYATGPVLPPLAREMAAVLACGPEAVLSHRSAAVVLGIVSRLEGEPVDVTVPRPYDRARPGIRVRRSGRLPDDERTRHDGIPITTAARTLVDLAGVASLPELERAMARAERERLVTRKALLDIVERRRGRPGVRPMRALLEHAHGPSLTRSEAEARFLALIRRARLPVPIANAAVGEYEIDFLWPHHKLAVEVDGYRFHASRPRFEADRRRIARLAAQGIQVIPVTWRQIVDDEVATAVQLGQALARARSS